MSIPFDDAQLEATYNGKDDAANTTSQNAAYLAASGDPAGSTAVATMVSGTARQVSSKRAADVYIDVTTSASLKIEMGPTSACAITVAAAASLALGVVSIYVPAGWYFKTTGTVTNYVVTYVLR